MYYPKQALADGFAGDDAFYNSQTAGARGLGFYGGVETSPFRPSRRQRSIGMVLMAVLLPCSLFVLLVLANSFSLQYNSPAMVKVLNAGAVLVALALMAMAVRGPDPAWSAFLALSCLLSVVLGILLGQASFVQNMRPYYDVTNLNKYYSVDPADYRGNQLMDAGRIEFTSNAMLDLNKKMGFVNSDTYCVVPITSDRQNGTEYDFWAVGLNCCTGGSTPDFKCGEYSNPDAHAALRLMSDEQRPFYRLAVQQAAAGHSLTARHPVFFLWLQHPDVELAAYKHSGIKVLTEDGALFAAAQTLLTVLASKALPPGR